MRGGLGRHAPHRGMGGLRMRAADRACAGAWERFVRPLSWFQVQQPIHGMNSQQATSSVSGDARGKRTKERE